MLFNNMIVVINMDCAAQYPCLEEALPGQARKPCLLAVRVKTPGDTAGTAITDTASEHRSLRIFDAVQVAVAAVLRLF